MTQERVAILGGGSMAAALAHVVASGKRPCTLWCPDTQRAAQVQRRHHPFFGDAPLSEGIVATTELGEALRGAALVVVAVASSAMRETARELGSRLAPGQALLSATKALEPRTYYRMSQVLAEEAGTAAVGAICGPNVTPEIVAGKPTQVVVASPALEVRARAARLLSTPAFGVQVHTDLVSAELAAALKNVVAIGVGIAEGRGLGSNFQSVVLARGLEELALLAAAMGADPGAFFGLAGLADAFLTATSAHSLNRRVGLDLGHGEPLARILARLPEVPEGVGSGRAGRALAARQGLDLPLLDGIARIIDGEASPDMLEDFAGMRSRQTETAR